MCQDPVWLKAGRSDALLAVILGGLIGSAGLVGAATRHVPSDYPTIQAAINASADGDSVVLAAGAYTGEGNYEIEFRGRDIVLTSSGGAAQTVIDCQYAGRGFNLHEGESRSARIERVTIRNGWARYHPGELASGGGICCTVSDPTIADCVIEGNLAERDGGGLYVLSSALVERCLIMGNSCGSGGGGVALEAGSPLVVDCVIVSNAASEGGGVACTGTAANTLWGCTISGNSAGHGGGVKSENRVYLERCVVWGNYGITGQDELVSYAGGGADIRCCDIDTTGVLGSNIDYDEFCVYTNPMFCDPQGGDFALEAGSPCLADNSPCGVQIGALGVGCGAQAPTGACCYTGGLCVVEPEAACGEGHGVYQGDLTVCDPNPCVPTPAKLMTWGRVKALHLEGARAVP